METVEENGFQKTCRTCLQKYENVKSIFDIHISDTNSVRVVDFIRRMTSIKMAKGDGLPENLCLQCVESICKAYNFTQLCISSDFTLRLQLKEKSNENTPEVFAASDKNECVEDSMQSVKEVIENVDGYLLKIEVAELLDRNVLEIMHEQEYKTTPSAYTKVQKCYNQEFKCNDCHKSFSIKRKLEKHVKVHDASREYKCTECPRSFPLNKHLTVHMRSHVKLEDKQHICEVCGQKFMYAYLLNQHKFKHTNDKPFPCTKCDRGCVTAESLRRHMKTHEEGYKKKKHVCSVCCKEFRYPSFLAEHMKNHTGEKPFLCSFCGRGFRQRGALEYHVRSHTGYKPYSCPNCHNRFTSKGVLRIHMRKYTNERPYVCDICGKAFARNSDLKSHHLLHTGRKEFLCSVCGKCMSSKGQLTVHLRSHTGEKPYGCDICQKAFATHTMLVKHIRIHTGERPYVCKICFRAFNQSSTLKTHRATHQKEMAEVGDDFLNNVQEGTFVFENN